MQSERRETHCNKRRETLNQKTRKAYGRTHNAQGYPELEEVVLVLELLPDVELVPSDESEDADSFPACEVDCAPFLFFPLWSLLVPRSLRVTRNLALLCCVLSL